MGDVQFVVHIPRRWRQDMRMLEELQSEAANSKVGWEHYAGIVSTLAKHHIKSLNITLAKQRRERPRVDLHHLRSSRTMSRAMRKERCSQADCVCDVV